MLNEFMNGSEYLFERKLTRRWNKSVGPNMEAVRPAGTNAVLILWIRSLAAMLRP